MSSSRPVETSRCHYPMMVTLLLEYPSLTSPFVDKELSGMGRADAYPVTTRTCNHQKVSRQHYDQAHVVLMSAWVIEQPAEPPSVVALTSDSSCRRAMVVTSYLSITLASPSYHNFHHLQSEDTMAEADDEHIAESIEANSSDGATLNTTRSSTNNIEHSLTLTASKWFFDCSAHTPLSSTFQCSRKLKAGKTERRYAG